MISLKVLFFWVLFLIFVWYSQTMSEHYGTAWFPRTYLKDIRLTSEPGAANVDAIATQRANLEMPHPYLAAPEFASYQRQPKLNQVQGMPLQQEPLDFYSRNNFLNDSHENKFVDFHTELVNRGGNASK